MKQLDRTVVINLSAKNLDAMLRALELVRHAMTVPPGWETKGGLARIRVALKPELLRSADVVAPGGGRHPSPAAPRVPAEVLLTALGAVGKSKLGFEYVMTSLEPDGKATWGWPA